jgi:hypothetical protein
MLGTFQQSNLRIEVNAPLGVIRDSLIRPEQFQRWLWFQRFSTGLPDQLQSNTVFTSWLGPISIQHQVDRADDHSLCLIMSRGIDGYQEWRWGDGWVQSSLVGISLLPLNLGQTASLLQLKQFLSRPES